MAIGLLSGNTLRIVTNNASALTVVAAPSAFAGAPGLVIDNQTLTANVVLGSGVNAIIRGTSSPDTLVGGSGNDTFYGGTGGDQITGGAGADVFFFTNLADGIDTFNGFQDGGAGGSVDRIGASKAGLNIAATVPTGVLAASLFATFPFSGITGTATTTVSSTFFSGTTFTRSLSVSEQVITTGSVSISTSGLSTAGTTSVSSSQQVVTSGTGTFNLTGPATFTAIVSLPATQVTFSGSVTATGSGTVAVGTASFASGTFSGSGTGTTPTGTATVSGTASFGSGTSNITTSFNVTTTGNFTVTVTLPSTVSVNGTATFSISGTQLLVTTGSISVSASQPLFATFSASQTQIAATTSSLSVSASEIAASTFTVTQTVIGSTVVFTANNAIFYYNSVDGQLFLDPDGFAGPQNPVLLVQFNNPIPPSPGFGAEDIFIV